MEEVKCVYIHKHSEGDENMVYLLALSDGVLQPGDIPVKCGQYLEMTKESYRTYGDSIYSIYDYEVDLTDYGTNVLKSIICTFFDVETKVITGSARPYYTYKVKDAELKISRDGKACTLFNFVTGLTYSCDLCCELTLNIPEFTIKQVKISDTNEENGKSSFELPELVGYCVRTQAKEIIALVQELKKKYKSSIKGVKNTDNFIIKFLKDLGKSLDGYSLAEDIASTRLENNWYSGRPATRAWARMNDEAVMRMSRGQ